MMKIHRSNLLSYLRLALHESIRSDRFYGVTFESTATTALKDTEEDVLVDWSGKELDKGSNYNAYRKEVRNHK